MGSITIIMVGNGFNRTETWTVSDAGMDVIVDYLRDSYPTPPTEAIPNPPRATVNQAIRRAANGIVDSWRAMARNHKTGKDRNAVPEAAEISAT